MAILIRRVWPGSIKGKYETAEMPILSTEEGMDNSAMTIRVIPKIGIGPKGQGAKEGLEVQAAREVKERVGADREEYSIYVQVLVTTELSQYKLSNCIRPKRSSHQILAHI